MLSTRPFAAVVCAVIGLSAAAWSAPAAAPYYSITDLGTVDQVASDIVPGLNGKGAVTVWRLSEKGGYRPVLVARGSGSTLPVAAGYQNEFAYSVNDRGEAAGWANTTLNPVDSLSVTHAVLVRGGKAIDLGTLGGRDSRAYAINDGGVVVGMSQIAGGRDQRAFRWSAGKMQALQPLPGGNFSIAFGVNQAGIVAGGASLQVKGAPVPPVHAVLWRGNKPQDLGVLVAGRSSTAFAVNNRNDVVGVADTRTDQTAFLCSQGHMTDLDINGRAFSINDQRQIVGTREGTERGYMVGWLWDNGSVYRLNDCIRPKSGYWIESGDKINDAGQIVCTARLEKRVHVLLLSPAKRP